MRAAGFLCLLALAACGGAPAANNTVSTMGTPAPDMGQSPEPPPAPDMGEPQAPAPAPQHSPSQSGGPRQRFVVCPGNPRCPPAGNQPGNR